jgi:uncharacterized phage-like protein YoqJ
MKKKETICFSGHRPKGLPWGYNEEKESCVKLKKDLINILINKVEEGKRYFLVGMAEGFDMICAETLFLLKSTLKKIKIIAVIPCRNQEIKWKQSQRERYNNILKQCDKVICLTKNYTPTCMNDRNMYMVDKSCELIAFYSGKPSGTKNTINYATQKDCKVTIIDANLYEDN